MHKIKEWFENLSGATKFMLFLAVLLTISNIVLIVLSGKKSEEAANMVNVVYSEDKQQLFTIFGLDKFIIQCKKGLLIIVLLLINIFFYYISYYVGKILGFFKSITEMFIDINKDGKGSLAILLYNMLSIFFDVYTMYSFFTIK